MNEGTSTAEDDARRAAEGRSATAFVERLLERIGVQANVHAVFGEPVERNGITIVPVARIRWGAGGGGGSARDMDARGGEGSGAGGGGGLSADPVGYLEIGPGGAQFKPIRNLASPTLLLVAGISASLLLRGLARILRR
jgi:uncharacterized spore protein YtfJ